MRLIGKAFYRAALAAPLALLPSLALAQTPAAALNTGDTAWILTSTALVLFMTLPGLALLLAEVLRRRPVGDGGLAAISVTWFAGTFLPFAVVSAVLARTSYLYYMLVVVPGMYLAAGWLLVRLWRRHTSIGAVAAAAVAVAAVIAYPLTPLPS